MQSDSHWEEQLRALEIRGLRRQLRCMDSENRSLLNFSSNDYLGLNQSPELKIVAQKAIEKYGIGSGASRLVCGTHPPHAELEETIAHFKKTESALVFSTGYATAVGCIPAIIGKEDVVILDKLAHASLIDGARLSGAVLRVFSHNHLEKLEMLLQWAQKKYPNAQKLIVTESIFSMDGDRCPLPEIIALKEKYGALLLLDEAHATGIIGMHGAGLAAELGVSDRVELQLGTLSKAVGSSGGFIAGSRVLIDLLTNRARSFIYSTAPPPVDAAIAKAAIEWIASPKGDALRKQLWENILIIEKKLNCENLQSAIVPILIGDEKKTVHYSKELEKRGILIPAIRYPTVPRKQARLRLTVSATQTKTQLEELYRILMEIAAGSD